MSEEYHGRLACDGRGNLLAEEGERAGFPVAYDPDSDSYVFVNPGEPSHNERHHKRFAQMQGTVDASMTDDPSLVNADKDNNAHHFETQPDDAHYDKNAPNRTRVRFDPDAVAAVITGHTDSATTEARRG